MSSPRSTVALKLFPSIKTAESKFWSSWSAITNLIWYCTLGRILAVAESTVVRPLKFVSPIL